MRLLGLFTMLLLSSGCESATKYKSELTNFQNFNSARVDDFDEYDLKDNKIKISLNFQTDKLYLKISNKSEVPLSFLPLDTNLGMTDNRCSIVEIYEDFVFEKSKGKKVNFETKYNIEKNTSKLFYYKFFCNKQENAFLTINGLNRTIKQSC